MRVTRIKIVKGEDKRLRFFLKGVESQLPINLSTASNIQFIFEKQDRTSAILDMIELPAVKAFADYNGGKFIADNAGNVGNSIVLNFDGVEDIDTVVNDWNIDNPTNTVSINLLTGSFVPSNSQIKLNNGLNAYTPVAIENPVLGEVSLIVEDKISNGLRLGESQSFIIIVDFDDAPQGIRKKIKVRNILDIID